MGGGGALSSLKMIAALFVERGGCYYGLEDVDPWPLERDARLYAGPWPVVCHSPCSRWCQLAGLVQARWGHKKGDDGGCFASALESVRKWGGVLEHPAYSRAWDAYGLPKPKTGGWHRELWGDGAVAHVEQIHYGHRARKATWLYAVAPVLPRLRWARARDGDGAALVSWCGYSKTATEARARISKKAASASPLEFRDVLLDIARSVTAETTQ